jgi:hypothetical protein
VYAPVGSHEDLLPYLVRRLLENGANSSFVNRITDETWRSTTWCAIRSRPSRPSPASRIRAFRCRAIFTAARRPTSPTRETTPWASTSPTTRSCAPSPNRSTPRHRRLARHAAGAGRDAGGADIA